MPLETPQAGGEHARSPSASIASGPTAWKR